MIYRDSCSEDKYLAMDVYEAFSMLNMEIAGNLFEVSNAHCTRKYHAVCDVFWGFPAEEPCPGALREIASIASSFLSLRYSMDSSSERFVRAGFMEVLKTREKLRAAMERLGNAN